MGSLASGSRPLTADDAASEAFDAILTKFAETGFFSSSTSPSIFVVYAHDNEKEGLSHAHSARQLIRWLRAIRSRTLSDKFPLPLSTPRNDGHEAIRNILSNQFCLLPFHDFEDGSRTIHSVDKVLVCGSEVLQHYFENSFTSSYIDSIEASYTKLVRQLAEPSTIKTRIRDVVEVESCHHAFHHVITELAFLKLRSAQRRKHHGIIPVSLNGDLMSYLSFEPFQNNCDLVMKLKSPGTAHLRLLFFDLLKQIYPEHHVMIQHFQECYDRIIKTHLNEGTVRETKLDELVRQELMRTSDAVARDQNAVLRDGYFDAETSHLCRKMQDSAIYMRRSKLLGELSTLPYRDRKDRNPEHVEGTCEWFTHHGLFQHWQRPETASLLWVSADPGCGKSVLVKHLVDNVLPSTDTRTTCYFFFKDDFEDQRSIEGALRCLLHQLFVQRPYLLSDQNVQEFEEDRHLLQSFTGLWDILIRASSHQYAGTIVCIIDALDECNEEGRALFSAALEKFYQDERSQCVLKFLITSRPYTSIQRGFQALESWQPTIHLSGEKEMETEKISQEISLVIAAKARDLGIRLKLREEEVQTVLQELTRVRQRTYLWTYLVFDVLEKSIETTMDHLKANIHKLPGSVEAAYEKILSRSHDTPKIRNLLHIIVAAERPLSLQEMSVALATKESPERGETIGPEPEDKFREAIRELCGLFLTVVDSKIYLLHQTAREFLVSKSTEPLCTKWRHSLLPMESHYLLAEICIWRLCSANFDELDVDEGGLPTLVQYAAEHWATHFRAARGMDLGRLVPQAKQLFNDESPKFNRWLSCYWGIGNPHLRNGVPAGFSPLMAASLLGLEQVVCQLLEVNKSHLYFKDETYQRSALSWACAHGHERTVNLLLGRIDKHRAFYKWISRRDKSIEAADYQGQTPLSHAAENGHENIIRLLLSKGANIEAADNYGQTPLLYAVENGNENVIRLLLSRGANIEATDKSGWTPLFTAVETGNENIIRLLLSKGANIETATADKSHWTPLLSAVEIGNENIIRLLLLKGANIEAADKNGWTSLLSAVEDGNKSIIRLLLSKGANIEATDKTGRTPLLSAVENGNKSIVRLLLSKGANIEATDMTGRTPLQYAADKGNKEIIRLLLSKGANFEASSISVPHN